MALQMNLPFDSGRTLRLRPGLNSNPGITHERCISMLYTIAIVMLVLWLLGLVSSYTLGGFVHVLLVIALVMFLVGLIGGRKA